MSNVKVKTPTKETNKEAGAANCRVHCSSAQRKKEQ